MLYNDLEVQASSTYRNAGMLLCIFQHVRALSCQSRSLCESALHRALSKIARLRSGHAPLPRVWCLLVCIGAFPKRQFVLAAQKILSAELI